jgi:hypothetical protein
VVLALRGVLELDDFIKHGVLFSSICGRLSSVLISYRVVLEKADQLDENNNWLRTDVDYGEMKQQMKEIGGARFSLLHFIQEMTIIALSKTVEDLAVELRSLAKYEFSFWDPEFDLPFHVDIGCLRNLNNSIKHSRGVIIDDDQPSNRSLIDDCGFEAGKEIRYLDLDLELYIAKAFFFQNALIEQVTGYSSEIEIPDTDEGRIQTVDRLLFPDALR